jgi:hypothetical protein
MPSSQNGAVRFAADWMPATTALPTRRRQRRVRGFCLQPSATLPSRHGRQPMRMQGLRAYAYTNAVGCSVWPNRDPIQEQGGFNLNEYVGNNSLDAIDPFGLACFKYRPLRGPLGIFGVMGNATDRQNNTIIGHEQLFFEDKQSPSNLGYFDDNKVKIDKDTSKYGNKFEDCGYNDCIMRKAVAKVKPLPFCLLGNDGMAKYNCQDWSDLVRTEYYRLSQDPAVQKECKPYCKKGGK